MITLLLVVLIFSIGGLIAYEERRWRTKHHPLMKCDACKQTREILIYGQTDIGIDLSLVEDDGTEIILPINLAICGVCFNGS